MQTYEVIIKDRTYEANIKELEALVEGFGEIVKERMCVLVGGTAKFRIIVINVPSKTELNRRKLMNDKRVASLIHKDKHCQETLQNFLFYFFGDS